MPRELHPCGLFAAEIIDHGTFRAATGTVQLGIIFRTEAGTITGYLPFTDKSIEHSLKKIAAIGYNGPLEKLNEGCMIGMKCKITVEHESNNGEMRDKVSWINPIDYEGGLKKDPESALYLSKFNALFSQKFAVKSTDENMPF